MGGKLTRYLPWGDRALVTSGFLFLIAVLGFPLAIAGKALSLEILEYFGYIVILAAFACCFVFALITFPFHIIRMVRGAREIWRLPRVNRHRDWKP
jgi:hypothetical protein